MVSIFVKNLRLSYPVYARPTLAGGETRLPTGGHIEVVNGRRRVSALRDVSFCLEAGDRLGLIGSNGSGKTTLLKVLYGIYAPTAGHLEIDGRVDALFNINLGFRREATGRRNIMLRGLVTGWTPEQIAVRTDEIIAFSELGHFIDMPFKTYSQGMAARLAFSIATSFEPEILLMDEWIGAGDPSFQSKARERMKALADKAGIVVLASHNSQLIERTCNKVLELENGRAKSIREIPGSSHGPSPRQEV